MKYYLIENFACKAQAENRTELYKLFGGKTQMIKDNGGVMPDIVEISEEEYEFDDGYDII